MAKLTGHDLRFHKMSTNDGSSKCDAYATGASTDTVWGVVFEIASVEKPRLDRAEGLGFGYDEKSVDVLSAKGPLSAFTYIASPEAIRPDLKPFAWYKQYVLDGAIEHELPPEYIEAIRTVATG